MVAMMGDALIDISFEYCNKWVVSLPRCRVQFLFNLSPRIPVVCPFSVAISGWFLCQDSDFNFCSALLHVVHGLFVLLAM